MSVQMPRMSQMPPPRSTSHKPRKGRLARWGFRLSLLALLLGIVYVAALIAAHRSGTHPAWAAVVAIGPGVILLLAAGGAALDLLEILAASRRLREFDRRETAQGFALDDASELLGRMRQGCLLRVIIPIALITGVIAVLVELPALAGGHALRVVQGIRLQSCTASLVPFTFDLDNSSTSVSIQWSAAAVESLPDGDPWAEIQPEQGILAPGEQMEAEVIPSVLVCQMMATTRDAGNAQIYGSIYSSTSSMLATAHSSETTLHVRLSSTGRTHDTTLLAMTLRRGALTTPPPSTPTARGTPSTPTATPSPQPTATPQPKPTATPAPPPQAQLVVTQHQDNSETCTTTPASAYTVTLDNQGSNVSVAWQFIASNGWATASPASGTVRVGANATFTVTPMVCPIGSDATVEQATLHLSFPHGGSQGDIALSDTIYGPPPLPSLGVTANQNAIVYVNCGNPSFYIITMNNLGGNVPVSWWFDFDGGTVWATATPSSGTLASGQGNTNITVTVFPGLMDSNYFAHLRLSFPQGGYQPDIPLSISYSAGCLI